MNGWKSIRRKSSPIQWNTCAPRLTFVLVTLQKLWAKLNPIGEWPMGIWAMIYINRFNYSEVCINGPRMAATDATDPQSITQAEILGQRQAVAFIEMLRKYVPGFEKAFLSHINDSIGVRETRRIVGYKTLRIDDVKAGVTGDDTIALGSYPIDIHGSKDYSSQFIHVDEPYGIPYLTTVCKTVGGLMMAGRCISVDREAYGSLPRNGHLFRCRGSRWNRRRPVHKTRVPPGAGRCEGDPGDPAAKRRASLCVTDALYSAFLCPAHLRGAFLCV